MDQETEGPVSSVKPVDLRRHRRVTERNMVIGAFLIMFLVGGAAVWYFYGLPAAVASSLCLGSGVGLFLLISLVLKLLEAI